MFGLQVYHADTGRFACYDKYYGRQLSKQGFQDALYRFLHNGLQFRSELLDPIIERLQQLYDSLASLDTFRFYSSSLLIMYNGAGWNATGSKLPPRASAPFNHGEAPVIGQSPDMDVDQCHASQSDSGCFMHDNNLHRSTPCSSGDGSLHNSLGTSLPVENDNAMDCMDSPVSNKFFKPQPEVDIRMIDFAHATYQGFRGDAKQHSGPDKGYLLGLKNLIQYFQQLERDHRAQCS